MNRFPICRPGSRVLLALLVASSLLVSVLPTPARAAGEKRAELSKSVLNVSALQPGKPATAALVLDIKPGFHAQSATPTADYLKALLVKPEDNPAITFGKPTYPPAKIIPFEEPKQLSVYEGQVIVRIPIEVKPDAPLGPTKITGTLRHQICDDKQCFPPEKVPFTIEAEIVAADKAVTPANEDVFKQAEKQNEKPAERSSDKPATRAAATVAPGGAVPPAPKAPDALLTAFGLAFVVGILFNIVPCVLPVLPLKALGFYEVSQHNRVKCFALGLAFSVGVVASFAALGLVVVVFRLFTWGELFSNPWFAGVLTVILVAMALNMFGLFTINLPTGVYGLSPRHDTYFGNVLFGILTAALSTPCTFGLFVTVLATALSAPPVVGLLLICTVGAGMASPYLLLSAFPELARRFPRTGPWAEVAKQFMGFLVLAVAVFFAQQWVGKLVGTHNTWWVLWGVLAAGGVFLVVRSFHYGKSAVAPTVATVLALLLIVPTLLATLQLTARPYNWVPYSPEAVASARAANKVVLVEFTAKWCATCHTLEGAVLNSKSVQGDVKKFGVEMVRADLTEEEAPGWKTLKDDLKAEGIPLTVVYSPSLAQPIRLAGLYGVPDLRDALARAAQGQGQSAVASAEK